MIDTDCSQYDFASSGLSQWQGIIFPPFVLSCRLPISNRPRLRSSGRQPVHSAQPIVPFSLIPDRRKAAGSRFYLDVSTAQNKVKMVSHQKIIHLSTIPHTPCQLLKEVFDLPDQKRVELLLKQSSILNFTGDESRHLVPELFAMNDFRQPLFHPLQLFQIFFHVIIVNFFPDQFDVQSASSSPLSTISRFRPTRTKSSQAVCFVATRSGRSLSEIVYSRMSPRPERHAQHHLLIFIPDPARSELKP